MALTEDTAIAVVFGVGALGERSDDDEHAATNEQARAPAMNRDRIFRPLEHASGCHAFPDKQRQPGGGDAFQAICSLVFRGFIVRSWRRHASTDDRKY